MARLLVVIVVVESVESMYLFDSTHDSCPGRCYSRPCETEQEQDPILETENQAARMASQKSVGEDDLAQLILHDTAELLEPLEKKSEPWERFQVP